MQVILGIPVPLFAAFKSFACRFSLLSRSFVHMPVSSYHWAPFLEMDNDNNSDPKQDVHCEKPFSACKRLLYCPTSLKCRKISHLMTSAKLPAQLVSLGSMRPCLKSWGFIRFHHDGLQWLQPIVADSQIEGTTLQHWMVFLQAVWEGWSRNASKQATDFLLLMRDVPAIPWHSLSKTKESPCIEFLSRTSQGFGQGYLSVWAPDVPKRSCQNSMVMLFSHPDHLWKNLRILSLFWCDCRYHCV